MKKNNVGHIFDRPLRKETNNLLYKIAELIIKENASPVSAIITLLNLSASLSAELNRSPQELRILADEIFTWAYAQVAEIKKKENKK